MAFLFSEYWIPKSVKKTPNDMEITNAYMNTADSAKYTGLSRQFFEIARHKGEGHGPPFIKLSRAVRYKKSDLDDWMRAHRRPG